MPIHTGSYPSATSPESWDFFWQILADKLTCQKTLQYVLSWVENLWNGDGDIYIQHIDSNGLMLWEEDGVAICTARNAQDQPAVIGDGENGAIVVWRDLRNEDFPNSKMLSDDEIENYLNFDIYAQRVDGDGVVQWEPDGVAIVTAPESQGRPFVVGDGHGRAIIAWADYRSGTNLDVYAQRVDINGMMQWEEDGIAICDVEFDQNKPQIVKNDSEEIIISWQDYRADTGFSDIYAQKINRNGTILWIRDGVAVTTAWAQQWFLKMISDGEGGAIMTWEDGRGGDLTLSEIYAQRINNNGEVQWTENGVVVCMATDLQVEPTITSDGANGAIITWRDGRDVESNIYAQQVSGQEVLGDVDLGTKGDVNKDGNINVLDVVLCVNIVIERGDMPAPEELYRADVDHSGEINVSDVLGMVDIILNRGNQI